MKESTHLNHASFAAVGNGARDAVGLRCDFVFGLATRRGAFRSLIGGRATEPQGRFAKSAICHVCGGRCIQHETGLHPAINLARLRRNDRTEGDAHDADPSKIEQSVQRMVRIGIDRAQSIYDDRHIGGKIGNDAFLGREFGF